MQKEFLESDNPTNFKGGKMEVKGCYLGAPFSNF